MGLDRITLQFNSFRALGFVLEADHRLGARTLRLSKLPCFGSARFDHPLPAKAPLAPRTPGLGQQFEGAFGKPLVMPGTLSKGGQPAAAHYDQGLWGSKPTRIAVGPKASTVMWALGKGVGSGRGMLWAADQGVQQDLDTWIFRV